MTVPALIDNLRRDKAIRLTRDNLQQAAWPTRPLQGIFGDPDWPVLGALQLSQQQQQQALQWFAGHKRALEHAGWTPTEGEILESDGAIIGGALNELVARGHALSEQEAQNAARKSAGAWDSIKTALGFKPKPVPFNPSPVIDVDLGDFNGGAGADQEQTTMQNPITALKRVSPTNIPKIDLAGAQGLMSFLGTRLQRRAAVQYCNSNHPKPDARREVQCEIIDYDGSHGASDDLVALCKTGLFGGSFTKKIFDMQGLYKGKYEGMTLVGLRVVPEVHVYPQTITDNTENLRSEVASALKAELLKIGVGARDSDGEGDWSAAPLPLQFYTGINTDGSYKSIGELQLEPNSSAHVAFQEETSTSLRTGATTHAIFAGVACSVRVVLYFYAEFVDSLGLNQG